MPEPSLRGNLRSAVEADPSYVELFENEILLFGGEPEDIQALAEGLKPDRRVDRADPVCRTTTIASGRHALKGGGFSFRDPKRSPAT